jgi:enoyl-CoA hydratase
MAASPTARRSALADYQTILVEQRGAVTLITLNRPEALNALSSGVLEELIAAFAAFGADPGQRCGVLTGSGGKAFAAGADIKEMAGKPAAEFYAEDMFARWSTHLVGGTRKPWIAAVNGFALGGGCELAMMADFIIAADTAKFGQPEITLGVVPGMGGSQRLTRAIGKAKAMDLILTGRTIDAAEAERAGLVARVVPAAELLDEALKTAEKIAAMPPLAVLAAKELVDAAESLPLEEGIRLERRLFHLLAATEDKAEGMAAFVEKRVPVWRGR